MVDLKKDEQGREYVEMLDGERVYDAIEKYNEVTNYFKDNGFRVMGWYNVDAGRWATDEELRDDEKDFKMTALFMNEAPSLMLVPFS